MKQKKYVFGLLLMIVALSSCDLFSNSKKTANDLSSTSSFKNSSSTVQNSGDFLYGTVEPELKIHYIDLGVSGDSILIDYGNYEILIDAGGNKSAGTEVIVPYIKKYVEDQIIELTIATHGHEDHIAGYVGLSNKLGVFEAFQFKTIVDSGKGYENLTALQDEYNTKRDAKIAEGSTYYTIRDIFDQHLEQWKISPDLTLTFLNQKFYNIPYTKTSQNLNDYSICNLVDYQGLKFLFTGDLEENGETSLITMNQLPTVDVFKAGHHGSKTASNAELLEVIQPKMAIFTADSAKEATYKFPHPETITRLTSYTQTFYTSYYNGHIVLNMKKDTHDIEVQCSEKQESFQVAPYLACYPTIEAIANIGSKITTNSLEKIVLAENLYTALSEEEKSYVYNYPTLVDARAKYDKLG